MTGAAAGRMLGVTHQALGQWVKQGCPRNRDNTYDLPAIFKWRVKHAEGGDDPTEEDWSTEGEKWRALKHKHQLEVEQGKYIATADAAAWWTDRVTEARTALQSVGPGMAPSLVGKDVGEIRDLLDARLRAISEDLARSTEATLGSSGNNTADE